MHLLLDGIKETSVVNLFLRGLIFYLKKVVSIGQLGRIKNPTTLLNSHHSTLCKACKYFDFSRNMKLKKFAKSKFLHSQINTPTFLWKLYTKPFFTFKNRYYC